MILMNKKSVTEKKDKCKNSVRKLDVESMLKREKEKVKRQEKDIKVLMRNVNE